MNDTIDCVQSNSAVDVYSERDIILLNVTYLNPNRNGIEYIYVFVRVQKLSKFTRMESKYVPSLSDSVNDTSQSTICTFMVKCLYRNETRKIKCVVYK